MDFSLNTNAPIQLELLALSQSIGVAENERHDEKLDWKMRHKTVGSDKYRTRKRGKGTVYMEGHYVK